MICSTHTLIADKAYQIAVHKFSIALDYESLIKGSIAPDKKPSMIIIPHTKVHSFGLLSSVLDFLSNSELSSNSNETQMISYNLGIMIHLISDYFCGAHNNMKFLNPITHYLYEKRLDWVYRNKITSTKFDEDSLINDVSENIQAYLDKKHLEYLKFQSSFENDYTFSINTVISVVLKALQIMSSTNLSLNREAALLM